MGRVRKRQGGISVDKPHPKSPGALLPLATILLVAANLRPGITVVGPLIEQIGTDTGASSAMLGLLGALPVLAFGVVSPWVHRMALRLGIERSVLIALLVLGFGTVLRSVLPDTAALYGGTALLGGGIAVGNVLVPALVKRDFPQRVPLMTGLYSATMAGCAAVASGAAVPLSRWLGWELTIGLSAFLALLAAAAWLLRGPAVWRGSRGAEISAGQRKPAGETSPGDARATSLWSSAVAWQVTLFFGLQSSTFYLMVTWLPAMQVHYGVPPDVAGLTLASYQGFGIVASLSVGPLMQRAFDQRGIAVSMAVLMMFALGAMMIWPDLIPVWSLFAGFSSGATLSIALSLVALRARTHHQASQLSGMAQGVGYLLAALGPFFAGSLFDLTGSWKPVLGVALSFVVAQAVAGYLAGRRVFVGEG